MPILNVGLGLVMWCGVALAAGSTLCQECAQCYRCTSYSGCNCTNCVYDANYCWAEWPACDEGFFYNQVTGECEPTRTEVIPIDCEEGYYLDGMLCMECPGLPSGTTILTESCRIQSMVGTLLNPRTGAEQCAMTAYETIGLIRGTQCEYQDAKGTFTFTADCFYSGSDSSGEDSGSEEEGSGEDSGGEDAGGEEEGSEEEDVG